MTGVGVAALGHSKKLFSGFIYFGQMNQAARLQVPWTVQLGNHDAWHSLTKRRFKAQDGFTGAQVGLHMFSTHCLNTSVCRDVPHADSCC